MGRSLLVGVFVVLAAVAWACGGGAEEEQVAAPGSPTPAATQPAGASPVVGVTPTPRGEPAAAGDEAFPGVPLPRGAVLDTSIRIGSLPGPVPAPSGASGQMDVKAYRVPQPPRQVADFYRGAMPQRGWSNALTILERDAPEYEAYFVFEKKERGKSVFVVVYVRASDGQTLLGVGRISE